MQRSHNQESLALDPSTTRQRILFVDDDRSFLEGIGRMLRGQRRQWELHFADSVSEAIAQTERFRFDAIVSDVSMPGEDGFTLLRHLAHTPATQDVPLIILTGIGDRTLKRRALEEGANDLLSKPVSPEDLVARLRNVLRLKAYQDELKRQNELLEARVRERTAELEESRLDIILRLGKVAEFRDEETGNHILRVGCYCRALAQQMQMDLEFIERLFLSSPLHDIGKIGIPDRILLKRGPLTPEERQQMQRHTQLGAEMLLREPNGFKPFLQWHRNREAARGAQQTLVTAADVALYHHERWDGAGYPKGLAGNDIPLVARITALADVYDALRSERPYKRAFPEDDTCAIIRQESGKHFDPVVVAAFEEIRDHFDTIHQEFSDEILASPR